MTLSEIMRALLVRMNTRAESGGSGDDAIGELIEENGIEYDQALAAGETVYSSAVELCISEEPHDIVDHARPFLFGMAIGMIAAVANAQDEEDPREAQ